MANNFNVIPKNFILSSPESIRKKLLDRLTSYEELNGVDLSKTQFFSYMIDLMSMMSADNANALSLSKRESYLVTANLPSSIYNWASYLSYQKDFAKPAVVDCLLSIPLNFKENTVFKIDYFTQFKAGDIIYTNSEEYINFSYDYDTNTLNGTAISTNSIRNIKITIDGNIAYTAIPLKQLEKSEEERFIPHDLQVYQPYSFVLSYNNKIADIKVFIQDDDQATEEEWARADNYFEMGLGEKKFYFKYENNNQIRILFGNDIFGLQPNPGAKVRVVIYNTKADKGSIIPASINKMDRILYSDSNGITKEITITPTNILASSQGVADESLTDTGRKAIARFAARQRIVSSNDFDSIKDIMSSDLPYAYATGILKRSDIKTNEVVLYVVLPKDYVSYEPQVINDNNSETESIYQTIPIPATSLVTTIPSTTTDIYPYATYQENGEDFLCPFGLVKETDSNGYYYYTIKSASTTPSGFVFDQVTYPLSFPDLTMTSDATFSNITFDLTYFNLNNTVNMANVSVILYLRFRTDTKGAYTVTVNDTTKLMSVDVPMNDILAEECRIEYHIKDTSTNSIIAKVTADYYMKRVLKNYIYSNMNTVGGVTTVYDVPCILKSYYDALTDDEKSGFETDILQKIIAASNFSDYRMTNVSINLKFARTYGQVTNYLLNNTTRKDVIDILNTPPASPSAGDRYIIGPEPTGAWIGHRSEIALYGTEWSFLEAAPGEIIYVTNKTAKYTFAGNANIWLIPTFNIPYDIEVFVYINSLADNDGVVANAVKNQLLYVLTTYSGIDAEQHRSIMYRAIQELGAYIDHCEIKIPQVDIVFNYNIDEFEQLQLKTYVPEFIYTDEDHITVKIIRV